MNGGAQGCLGQWAALCDATVGDTGHPFVQSPRVTLPWAVGDTSVEAVGCDKRPTPRGGPDGGGWVCPCGAGLGGKPLRVPLSFAVNPQLLQKESLNRGEC